MAYPTLASGAINLPTMAGRRIVPRGAAPQAVARSLMATETFSTPAQRAMEMIASQPPYTKVAEPAGDGVRRLVWPESPDPADSAAAVREVLASGLAPEPLLFFDDPFPRTIPGKDAPPQFRMHTGTPRQQAFVRDARQQLDERLPIIMADTLRGALVGQPSWYPAQQAADLIGPRNWTHFADLVAATTSGRNPPSNFRGASYIRQLLTDRDLARRLQSMSPEEAAKYLSDNHPYPETYGSLAQQNDFRAVANMLHGVRPSDMSAHGIAKSPHFGQNVDNNMSPLTVDRHVWARLGYPERQKWNNYEKRMDWTKTSGGEAAYEAAQLQADDIGRDLGLNAAQVQEMGWVGGAPMTGVDPIRDYLERPYLPPSALHVLEDRILRAPGVDPTTPAGIKRGRGLLRRALTGGAILPSAAVPIVSEE